MGVTPCRRCASEGTIRQAAADTCSGCGGVFLVEESGVLVLHLDVRQALLLIESLDSLRDSKASADWSKDEAAARVAIRRKLAGLCS